MTTKPDAATPKSTKTKTGWKKRALHEDMTLPSGQVVDVRLPNLPYLLKAGSIPNPLVDAAIQFSEEREITSEMLEESFDFIVWAVPRTIVSPEVTEEDVESGELPAEDLDMIAAWIARSLDTDAVGKHLGGLDTNADWRRFRGRISIDEIAAELEGRG